MVEILLFVVLTVPSVWGIAHSVRELNKRDRK
jgi:hypothetical protein